MAGRDRYFPALPDGVSERTFLAGCSLAGTRMRVGDAFVSSKQAAETAVHDADELLAALGRSTDPEER